MTWATLIYYYLFTKAKILIFYSSTRRMITDTRNITVSNNGKTYSVFWRYCIIRILRYFLNFNKYLIRVFDINAQKIQITKDSNVGEYTAIIDSNEMSSGKTNINHIIKHIEHKGKKDDITNNKIFIKLELVSNNNDQDNKICLKEFTIKYRDADRKHHNTLSNILNLNNISVDEDKALINIIYFDKNKRRQSLTIPYIECKDKHINFLNELE